MWGGERDGARKFPAGKCSLSEAAEERGWALGCCRGPWGQGVGAAGWPWGVQVSCVSGGALETELGSRLRPIAARRQAPVTFPGRRCSAAGAVLVRAAPGWKEGKKKF